MEQQYIYNPMQQARPSQPDLDSPLLNSGVSARYPSLSAPSSGVHPADPPVPAPKPQNKLLWYMFILVVLVTVGVLVGSVILTTDEVVPIEVGILWPKDRDVVMEVGTSRVLEVQLYSGSDDRTRQSYKAVTMREIAWVVEPKGVVTVDMYGRVNAIKEGNCTLRVQPAANSYQSDERTIIVVNSRQDIDAVPRRVIDYKGQPANPVVNLQKLVHRYTKKQILAADEAPKTVKYAVQNLEEQYPKDLQFGDIKWSITPYADQTPRQFIRREDTSMYDDNRDTVQYFIGDRYLPGDGTKVIMMDTDGQMGLWAVGPTGDATHIELKAMSYSEKAAMMVEQTQKYVLRHGLAAGAVYNGEKWVKQISDNDGLWTAMYGAGELMKYSVLRDQGKDQAAIAEARKSALLSLRAVLLVANVAGRQGRIQAKIRYLNNTRTGDGVFYSKQYLLEGRPNLRDTYPGLPSDGIGLYGVDAGLTVDGDYLQGKYRYSFLPLKPQDWAKTGTPATTERTLDSYMSRTFVIPQLDGAPPGGLFFKRNKNKTHNVLSSAHLLYDYNDTDHPALQLGNKPIPQALKPLLNIDGKQYDMEDLVYKGDTSTDEVIGHLFIYKIAFDILNEADPEQKQLKQLIKQTMRNFAQHLINNGYSMVDATGQATKWTKLFKEFLASDYSIEDSPLKAIQLLLTFKLAYYVTGERKFKQQYEMLALDENYRYIDLVGCIWERWVWVFTKTDDSQAGLYRLNYTLSPSEAEIERHTQYQVHFSDEEEAYLAYYLAFQLEEDAELRQKYRKGLNGYWHSMSRTENPLWYYIYQLSQPDVPQVDHFKNSLLETSSWALSRHMIDTTKFQAFVLGSRNDVLIEGSLSVDPTKVVGVRTSKTDEAYASKQKTNFQVFPQFDPHNIYEIKVLPADERSLHKFNGNNFDKPWSNHSPDVMEASTTYTLPYWLGVYHKMIKAD